MGEEEEEAPRADGETQAVADLVAALKEDLRAIKKLKSENKLLREEVVGLLQNNSKFAALVESLDDSLKDASEGVPQKYNYSFMEGGWRPKGSLNKQKVELGQKRLDIQDINGQLEEIIRLLKKEKKEEPAREEGSSSESV